MITLFVLCIIWSIVAYIRTKNRCLPNKFNPFNATPLEYLGMLIGFICWVAEFIYICISYLP